MTTISTNLRNTRESARQLRFEPVGSITDTNVQKAIERVATQPVAVVGTNVTAGMSPYQPLVTDSVLYVDTSGGPVTIALRPSSERLDIPLTIKDISGDAATNNITLDPAAGETVDELDPYTIVTDFGGVRLYATPDGYTVAP